MVKKILNYTESYRNYTYGSILVLLLAVVSSVIPFFLVNQLILLLITHQSFALKDIIVYLAGIAVCLIANAVLYVYGLSLSHYSAYNTLKNIRIAMQMRLEKLPLGKITEKGTGALKKMFNDDIESMELLLAHGIPEGIANLFVPISIYVAMFFIDWKLALLSLASIPLGLFAVGMMSRIGLSRMDAYYQSAEKMNNTIIEYVNGMEVVKIFNKDGESYQRFKKDILSYRDFTFDWYKACWPWMALYNSILPCVCLVMLPLGAWFVLQDYSSLPDFILILCMGFSVGVPLLKALSFVSLFPQLNYKLEQLEKMLDSPPLEAGDQEFIGNDYNIQFEEICFSYEKDEVLHGVSFEVKAHSMTALVGESGSGKSTLAKLLIHYYDLDSGSITIGGQDLRKMSLESLNDQIAYVAQEQFLFNTTLYENIRMGNLDATEEEVLAAAEKAQCMDFLARLDKGIYTMAGDSGKQLSGGERQRISLARALLKDAPIIVFDEATAFVDPDNEEKMNKAISEIIKEKTVIVIAHRLRSIMNADQICVMDAGNLVMSGTHQELLRDCSKYQKLWHAANLSEQWDVRSIEGGLK